MSEKRNPPTLKNKWGKLKLSEWTNQYQNKKGEPRTSKNYTIEYTDYNVDTGEYTTTGKVSIDRDCDLSIIKYFIDELMQGKVNEFLKDGQYSLCKVKVKDKPTVIALKKEYTDKENVQQVQSLHLKSKRDIVHFSALLNETIRYLLLPEIPNNNYGAGSFTQSNQQSNNESEFVDETQDDDIPF